MADEPAERWARLVRDRFAEMARLAPDEDRRGSAFWDTRASRYAARVAGTARGDPFLPRVRRHVGRRTVVVDVGAGTGRFALALAPHVAQVVAVDPSEAMLAILREEADRLGVSNVRTLAGRWEDVEAPEADVAICAHVLPLIEDAFGFLRKLDAVTRRRAFVCLGAASPELATDPLWRHFHGQPRRPMPTYLDAVELLQRIGAQPTVEVAETRVATRFENLDEAVESYRDALLLPDTEGIRDELSVLLRSWLAGRDGELRPPISTLPTAVLTWEPGSQRHAPQG